VSADEQHVATVPGPAAIRNFAKKFEGPRPRQGPHVAIRFVLPAQESESVAFAYSPVVEAVLSLHVLVAPKHHPLQHAWVRRMRRLDPKLRAEIQAFRFAYAGRWPSSSCGRSTTTSLIYPPRSVREEAAPKLPSGELVDGLRALGDDTRLRVLALIAERPRSTQELAPLVGLSEAGLSKHLRLLARAGVLESRRDGYYVLYSLVPDRLVALSATLLAFIRPAR
jgi:DNA-binding transcriptional ArsR family regulator